MFWRLWNFKSRLLVLDLIFVQTSGFHLVAVTSSQFTSLVHVSSLSFHRTTSFVRTIFLTIFAMVAFTSAGQASSMLYSAAVEPSKSIFPESLALWFSFSFVLSIAKSEWTWSSIDKSLGPLLSFMSQPAAVFEANSRPSKCL